MALSAQHIKAAQQHLRRNDPVMKAVLKRVGPCTLKLKRNRLDALVRSIVSQQISTAAATTISGRLEAACGEAGLTAQQLLSLGETRLREAGLSRQKTSYLIDLCEHVERGTLNLSQIGRCDDETVIEQLTMVRGIGRWTAQMFLIFSLGRLDVVAPDDLGLKTAQQKLYGLETLPNASQFHATASSWRPYASIASWYCWRAMDMKLDAEKLGLDA